MPKKEEKQPTGLVPVWARALVDIPALGVRCGAYFEAPQAVLAPLVAAGVADDKVVPPEGV